MCERVCIYPYNFCVWPYLLTHIVRNNFIATCVGMNVCMYICNYNSNKQIQATPARSRRLNKVLLRKHMFYPHSQDSQTHTHMHIYKYICVCAVNMFTHIVIFPIWFESTYLIF